MKKVESNPKFSKIIAMSAKTKEKIAAVANNLKGKDLFAEKVELAKKTLSDVKSLPI